MMLLPPEVPISLSPSEGDKENEEEEPSFWEFLTEH
jgi:hypothetical protein